MGVSGATGRSLREQIDVLLADGATLDEVEREVIAGAPLSEDSRDALWLYAWGCVERGRTGVAVFSS